jgi:hypothetical protein
MEVPCVYNFARLVAAILHSILEYFLRKEDGYWDSVTEAVYMGGIIWAGAGSMLLTSP